MKKKAEALERWVNAEKGAARNENRLNGHRLPEGDSS
jgi:hypothetical protein